MRKQPDSLFSHQFTYVKQFLAASCGYWKLDDRFSSVIQYAFYFYPRFLLFNKPIRAQVFSPDESTSFNAPEAGDHLPFLLKLFQEDLPHQVTGLDDLGIRDTIIDIDSLPSCQDNPL